MKIWGGINGASGRSGGIACPRGRARENQSDSVIHQNGKPIGCGSKLNLIGIPIDLNVSNQLMFPGPPMAQVEDCAWMEEVRITQLLPRLVACCSKRRGGGQDDNIGIAQPVLPSP